MPDLPLARIAGERGILFGAAITGNLLAAEPELAALMAREVAVVVPEYEAKWGTLQPEEGRFDTAPLDALLGWAQHFRKAARGHALVWHEDLPDWARAALAESPRRAREMLESHVVRVLGHTRMRIRDWDVLNEPIANPAGSDNPQPGTDDLRDTPWLRALGPDYMALALRTARGRDATLRLVLNDYGVEADTPWAEEKRRRLLRVVRALRERGVPLDGVGIQGHLQMREPFRAEPFLAFVRALRALDLAVLITELDVREALPVRGDFVQRDAAVALRVHAFLSAALEGGVRTVLTWGLSDRFSWLHRDQAVAIGNNDTHRGLPFDWEMNRKQMWRAMARAFAGQGVG